MNFILEEISSLFYEFLLLASEGHGLQLWNYSLNFSLTIDELEIYIVICLQVINGIGIIL
ncbi:MAG: hypothetical protein CEE43_06165 [Promethearchaeota archaeon Loki_b32]|nr:MAG: hypothetical protein CEE43_06165 [Candidatus Lokiarchaeota archaeon Loki_b32]